MKYAHVKGNGCGFVEERAAAQYCASCGDSIVLQEALDTGSPRKRLGPNEIAAHLKTKKLYAIYPGDYSTVITINDKPGGFPRTENCVGVLTINQHDRNGKESWNLRLFNHKRRFDLASFVQGMAVSHNYQLQTSD